MAKSKVYYANNARTTLSAPITNTSTSISVTSAAKFPSGMSAGGYFYVTLTDGTNLEVVKVTGVSGNDLTGCARGQEGTTANAFVAGTTKVENRLVAGNLLQLARLTDRMDTVAGVDALQSPSTADSNSYIAQVNSTADTALALFNGNGYWKLVDYPHVLLAPTAVGSSATTTSLQLAGANTLMPDSTAKSYVVQFVTGTLIGLCRYVTATSGTTVTWATALPSAPSSGDTYIILQSIPSKTRTNLGTANPLVNGTAAPGTSTLLSRQDHVHPTDTSRSPISIPNVAGASHANLLASDRGAIIDGIATGLGGSGSIAVLAAAWTGPGTDLFEIFNNSTSQSITITQGTGITTMKLLGDPTSSGTRTLGPMGMATIFLRNSGADAFLTGVNLT